MSNQLTSNPIIFDAAASASGTYLVRQIQWVDDAADIADDDDLVLTINGVTFTHKIALAANTVNNTVVYQAGPFNPGIRVIDFTVTTIDHGILVVWID
jgi:hypothetical protein